MDAEDFMAKNEALPIRQQVRAYLASCEDGNSQDTDAQGGAGSSFRASPPVFNPSGSKYLLRPLISYVGFLSCAFYPLQVKRPYLITMFSLQPWPRRTLLVLTRGSLWRRTSPISQPQRAPTTKSCRMMTWFPGILWLLAQSEASLISMRRKHQHKRQP